MNKLSDNKKIGAQAMKSPDSPSVRVFPPIQSDIYSKSDDGSPLTPDQRVARNIIALANKEFTKWERLLGWKLNAPDQIGRLLLQHRLAVEAELAAEWQRADFFWNQVHIEIKALFRKNEVWQSLVLAVAKEAGVEIMGNPVQLRQRLVDELLIDTHYAFYNGIAQQVEKLSLKDRAFVHIGYMEKLLNLPGLSQDKLLSMLRLPWEQQLALYQEAKKWNLAIQLCTERQKYFPISIEYQNELIEVCFLATLAKLHNGESEAEGLKDAKTLQGEIRRLEKFSKDYPYNLSLFEFLGHLHHLRAIALGNGGRLSEALVEVSKGMTHNPYIEQGPETRAQLVGMMNQLQAQMEQIPRDATLNEKGKRLLTEANQGFAPMNDYIKSAAAKATVGAFRLAQALSIWRQIGLPEPEMNISSSSSGVMVIQNGEELPTDSTLGWSRQVLLLWDGVNMVFNNPPRNPWDLAAAWEAVVAQKPELAELDRGLIYTFLDRKLFRSTDESIAPKTPVPPLDAPLINSISTKPKRSAEPFIPWLFSRQDIRIKLQAAVASVLVLTAGGLTIQDTSVRSVRDAAYKQIQKASQGQDYLKVVEEAEKFLANTPLSRKDGRDEEVKNLYSEAFVRWFAQKGDQLDGNAEAHIERYRALMNK